MGFDPYGVGDAHKAALSETLDKAEKRARKRLANLDALSVLTFEQTHEQSRLVGEVDGIERLRRTLKRKGLL